MELTEGIIIKTINYKESSKLIYMITDRGLASLEVKGANKINGHSHLYANLLSKIAFSENKHFLSSAKVLDNYVNIKNDFNRLEVTLKILELSYTLIEHITDFEIYYHFLSEILDLINSKDNYLFYESIFYIKTLYLLGIAPSLNACVNCGKKENLLGFVFARGGMICRNCYKTSDSIYDKDVTVDIIKLYYTKLDALKENEFDINYNGIKDFYIRYYSEYLGYNSKSKNIFDKVK